MFVKLLKNKTERDRFGNEVGLKVAKRRNRQWTPPQVVDGKIVESDEPQFIYTPFVVGAIIEVSQATGEKYIEAGEAEIANSVPAEVATDA